MNDATLPRSMPHDATPSWYRQPWPWVLIGLPGAAVIASIVSLFIAINGADDRVADNYYKQGLAINRELRADDNAQRRQLHAQLDFAAGTVAVSLHGDTADISDQLTMRVMHPVSAARDFALPLLRDHNGIYRARLMHSPTGRWTVEIDDARAHWRLRREIRLASDRQQVSIAP